jgi:hypothetical protein
MLLRRSGENSDETYNLNPVTRAGEGEIGIPDEAFLLRLAEAVYEGDSGTLAAMRDEGRQRLGAQALVDAIAVACGFNGITKVANATGIPLDEDTENTTVEMRSETNIDDYAESYKAVVYR